MSQSTPAIPPAPATYLPKEEGGLSFPPERTAPLVIDPVNDFLSEGGAGPSRMERRAKHGPRPRTRWVGIVEVATVSHRMRAFY